MSLTILRKLTVASLTLSCLSLVIAANRPQKKKREHIATESERLKLERASEKAPFENKVIFNADDSKREVEANGIPQHKVAKFPNKGNPHQISEQEYHFHLPRQPKLLDKPLSIYGANKQAGPPNYPFGIALNGVLFDPGTAEYWRNNSKSGWNYEALGGAVPLGIDDNHAHVQPNGAYHYHGLPSLYLKNLKLKSSTHSPLIGWAADGFPIYALYGYKDPRDPSKGLIKLKSSYRLKQGKRPGGKEPDGRYDGAFVQDYEYIHKLGDLDECNGRFTITPEFPEGSYAYFLSEAWPVIPRYFSGEPVSLRHSHGDENKRRDERPNRRKKRF